MTERNKSDILLGEKLNSVKVNPPEGIWEAIEGSLFITNAPHRRGRIVRKTIYWVSAAAVVILSAIISLPYLPNHNVNVKRAVSVVESAKEMKYEVSDTPVQVAPAVVSATAVANIKAVTATVNSYKVDIVDSKPETGSIPAKNTEEVAASHTVMAETNANLPHKDKEPGDNVKYYEKNYKTDDFAALEYEESIISRKRNKYSLSFSSNIAPGANTAVNSGFKMASFGQNISSSVKGVSVVERTSSIKYSIPFSIGVQLQMKLSKNLNVGAGINYSYLRSKYDGLINKQPYSIKQSLHYIGIPVNLYALFPFNSNILFYINAGGTIEKGIRAVNYLKSYNDSYHISNSISGVQYSVNGGVGFEYKFSKSMGLYLEPNAVYYFNSDVPASIRTDQPFQFKVEIGFRIHL